MQDNRTRRELLKTATAVTIGATTIAGTTNATSGSESTGATAGPVQDAPYTVATAQKSVFAPEILTIPVGATVEFRGNQYPHTITSTASLADVATNTSGDCSDPHDGDDVDTFDGEQTQVFPIEIWEHTIQSSEEPYHVRLAEAGLSYITYEDTGEYPYYCVPHCGSFMMGKIQVVEAPE